MVANSESQAKSDGKGGDGRPKTRGAHGKYDITCPYNKKFDHVHYVNSRNGLRSPPDKARCDFA
jgi:hypothetical protein